MNPLPKSQIQEALNDIPEWTLRDGKLFWEHQFEDFKAAFQFMTQLAEYAESVNHHPEWFNVYNQLRIELRTHDANGITTKDIDFAKRCSDLIAKI